MGWSRVGPPVLLPDLFFTPSERLAGSCPGSRALLPLLHLLLDPCALVRQLLSKVGNVAVTDLLKLPAVTFEGSKTTGVVDLHNKTPLGDWVESFLRQWNLFHEKL